MIEVVELGVPAGSLLVRLALPTAEAPLPRVPTGHVVTVAVGAGTPAPVTAALRSAGYRPAEAGGGTPHGKLELLVPPALAGSGSRWWDEVVRRAEQVFDLRMGPVRQLFDDELALHAAALGPAR